jgi:transcriptional regulator with XRE-family HTH domain
MNDLRSNLRNDFQDEEFRNVYADDSLNTYIATQIKVLREQQELTQTQLAEKTGMAQPRIAVLEDVNYSSWSINTLRRLARAFGLRLSVSFETFSSLIPELETFGKPALERTRFEDDPFFQEDTATACAPVLIGAEVFLDHMQGIASSQANSNKLRILEFASFENDLTGASGINRVVRGLEPESISALGASSNAMGGVA